MAILLLILKIFGIILLVLLGLVIVGILSLMFVPGKYSLLAELLENHLEDKTQSSYLEEVKEAKVKFSFSWLFHIIAFKAVYEEQKYSCYLRILFIKKRLANGKSIEEVEEEEILEEDSDEDEDVETDKKRKKKKSPITIAKELGTGLLAMIVFINDEKNKNVATIVIKEIKSILKHYGPRHGKGKVKFGTSDPSITGKTLGFLSLMPCMYQKGFHLIPDFQSDRLYIYGTIRIKGRCRGIHILKSAFVLWKNPQIRDILKNRAV